MLVNRAIHIPVRFGKMSTGTPSTGSSSSANGDKIMKAHLDVVQSLNNGSTLAGRIKLPPAEALGLFFLATQMSNRYSAIPHPVSADIFNQYDAKLQSPQAKTIARAMDSLAKNEAVKGKFRQAELAYAQELLNAAILWKYKMPQEAVADPYQPPSAPPAPLPPFKMHDPYTGEPYWS